MSTQQVRVRIAPSPTGHLHVGTARTALYNYLYARRHNGTFVLRLEDTDEERSREEYTKDIVDGLRWLGLDWEEGLEVGGPYPPYRQTEKIDHYNNIASKLISSQDAYLCFATAEELAALKEEQRAAGAAPRYDNRGRDLTENQRKDYEKEGRIPSIRFKVEEPQVVSWHDAVKGEIAIDSSDLGGDMVIVKSNGVAIYNFAVVVDDVDMHMTHVIRGEDHIHNTAKQILIYKALGYDLPLFAHVPLIFDLERQKLSKRKHGETVHIDYYRKEGYIPEAIVNYLAQMSWTHPQGKEIYSLAEAAEVFDLDKVSKSPAVFDVAKLNWFNSHYLRDLPLDLIVERAMPYLADFDLSKYSKDEINKMVALIRESLTTLSQIKGALAFFFDEHVQMQPELKEIIEKEGSRKVLADLSKSIDEQSVPFGDNQGSKKAVDAIGKTHGLKGKDLYWPVRVALSGSTAGPDLGAIISILGPERVKQRLATALTT